VSYFVLLHLAVMKGFGLTVALAAIAATSARAVELTPDNWDEMTAGKSVFIKFLAPW
jgi:hypothetical protein